ncbi:hypothetical protein [Methylobacterium sp. V23]|jgi:hypothetical protein|uniref:hypothetical protein n=1 Tax=Methylobacterium sp. V23 TaxID=2044878 RepID=UPI0015E1A99E|nr:hypothetical protein [Methylobacterium sp. V23]
MQRNEAQMAMEVQKERVAQMAWTDLSDANQAQDDKIGRLKALRMARLVEQKG